MVRSADTGRVAGEEERSWMFLYKYSIKLFHCREIKETCIMGQKKDTMELLQQKINECDDLIVEISQLRYQLDDILILLSQKTDNISSRHTPQKQMQCAIASRK